MTAATATAKKHLAPETVSQPVLDLKNADRSIREDASYEIAANGTPRQATELCSLLYDDDIAVRNLAAEVLVKLGPTSVQALLEEAFSADSDVRKFVVDIMTLIGDKVFVSTLIKLLDDANDNVVGSAAEALGRIQDPLAIAPLIKCQEIHPSSELQVIEALGNIGSGEALSLLYQKLKSDNVVLAYASVEAVGKIGTPEALNKLLNLLEVKNLPLRNAVLSTVLKLAVSGNRKELNNASSGRFVDYLIEAALSDDANIRASAIKELAFWSGQKVVTALVKALGDPVTENANMAQGALRITGDSSLAEIVKGIKEGDDNTKRYLIEVSAFLKSFELFDIINAQVDSDIPEIRMAIARAMSKYSDPKAIQTLLKLTRDDVGHVRAEALKSLGLVGDKTIVDKIYPLLNDEYSDVREACLGAMVLINGKLTVNFFKRDIESTDIQRRIMAVRALGWIGEADAAEVLLDALNNDVADVRKYAALGLAKIGHERLEENLTFLLTDESPEVRKSVIDASIQIDPQKAPDKIRVLLDDDDIWVRFYVINALASLNDMGCLDKLLEIALAQPPLTQIAIIGYLAKINDCRAEQGLRLLSGSENQDISNAAKEALEARYESSQI